MTTRSKHPRPPGGRCFNAPFYVAANANMNLLPTRYLAGLASLYVRHRRSPRIRLQCTLIPPIIGHLPVSRADVRLNLQGDGTRAPVEPSFLSPRLRLHEFIDARGRIAARLVQFRLKPRDEGATLQCR